MAETHGLELQKAGRMITEIEMGRFPPPEDLQWLVHHAYLEAVHDEFHATGKGRLARAYANGN